MIAKKIPAPKNTNSFGGLVKYTTNEEKQGEISYQQITNCMGSTIDEAVYEVELTQARNTRSNSNKTYHLLISFAEGEILTNEQLSSIEQRLVESIGFGDHQRISALHSDTNNPHLHVAINKVHPETFANISSFQDFKKLSVECRLIEEEYGLDKTHFIAENNKNKDINVSGRAGDFESHQNLGSLLRYIKEEVLSDIKSLIEKENSSFNDLHKLLDSKNLELKKRGAGLVFKDKGSDIHVKASSVDRALSKKNIEESLNSSFTENKNTNTSHKTAYSKKPIDKNSSVLWEKFNKYKDDVLAERKLIIDEISLQKRNSLKEPMEEIKQRRVELKSSKLHWTKKKDIKANLFLQQKKIIEDANKFYTDQRALLDKAVPVLNWTGYLQKEAVSGNSDALSILRRSNKINSNSNYSTDTIYWNKVSDKNTLYTDINHTLDKRGRVQYHLSNEDKIFVDSQGIRPTSNTKESIKVALDIAVRQYGKNIKVDGSKSFIENVKKEASQRKMDISINNVSINQSGSNYER